MSSGTGEVQSFAFWVHLENQVNTVTLQWSKSARGFWVADKHYNLTIKAILVPIPPDPNTW